LESRIAAGITGLEVDETRRTFLVISMIVIVFLAVGGSASAHIPFGSPDNPQWGCITTSDPWTGTNPSGVGPFDATLVAGNARTNTCGNK
jgi:hypothetical protein